MSIAATGLSRMKIRQVTEHLRKIAGLDKSPYFPIVEFIEFVLGDPDNDFNYEIVDPGEMEDMYGNTNTATNTMRIRSDVYRGAIAGNPRDRFTLCHELGHYFLHQPEFMSHARGNVPRYRDPEWQANTFAAELMAPYSLTKDMSVQEIMKECVMSKQAATIQYNEYHKMY